MCVHSNDKNLCSKALLSGVKAFGKADLVEEVDRLKTPGVHNLTPTQPHTQNPVSTQTQTLICTPSQTRDHQKTSPFPGQQQNEQSRSDGGKEREMEEKRKKAAEEARELSSCVSVLEDCLKEVLSQVLEIEMKEAYEELWTEVNSTIFWSIPYQPIGCVQILHVLHNPCHRFYYDGNSLQPLLTPVPCFSIHDREGASAHFKKSVENWDAALASERIEQICRCGIVLSVSPLTFISSSSEGVGVIFFAVTFFKFLSHF